MCFSPVELESEELVVSGPGSTYRQYSYFAMFILGLFHEATKRICIFILKQIGQLAKGQRAMGRPSERKLTI